MKKIALLLVVCLGLCPLALAQPQISGPLSGTMGPGTYLVVGNCTVNGGQILILLPGTTFLFAGHYDLVVNTYGRLHAIGTAEDFIVFTRQNPDTACDWGGIRFPYGSYADTLSYCRFEYATYHPTPNVNGGALFIQTAGMKVTHCTFANNAAQDGGGIYVNTSSGTISDCAFINNSASQNGGGLNLMWSSNITVSNCLFLNNASHGT